MNCANIAALVVGTLVVYGVMYYSIRQIRSKHPGWIPTIWYIFGLACSITFVVAYWANSTGAIDQQGNPHNEAGKFILRLLLIALNLNDVVGFLCALLFLVVVPQVISYVFSAPFGCATRPVLIGPAITFATWVFAKSLVVAGAEFASVELSGFCLGWPGFGMANLMKYILLASWAVSAAFMTLYFHYESSEVMVGLSKLFPDFTRRLRRLHRCATRHRRPHRQDDSAASFRLERDGISLVLRPKTPVVTIRIGGLAG